jgi:hypothetical protein
VKLSYNNNNHNNKEEGLLAEVGPVNMKER